MLRLTLAALAVCVGVMVALTQPTPSIAQPTSRSYAPFAQQPTITEFGLIIGAPERIVYKSQQTIYPVSVCAHALNAPLWIDGVPLTLYWQAPGREAIALAMPATGARGEVCLSRLDVDLTRYPSLPCQTYRAWAVGTYGDLTATSHVLLFQLWDKPDDTIKCPVP